MRGAALKKYKVVLLECKKSTKDLAGDKWTLGALKYLSTNDVWTWSKSNGIVYDGYVYLGLDICIDSKKEFWFHLGKCMCRKHKSVYQDHLKCV